MENLVNYAKSYAKHGFSVIPIVNKRPLVKFANRPALTKEEIDAIWTKHPTASIALQTREFLVIDVDRHEGGDDDDEGGNADALGNQPPEQRNDQVGAHQH